MEEAQVNGHLHDIALALFGEEAIGPGRGRKIHGAIQKFVSDITVNCWHTWRTQIKRHRATIVSLTFDVNSEWDSTYPAPSA